MKRFLVLTLLCCASASWARPIRVCIIGDSISEGFSPATRGWSSYVAATHAGEDFGVRNVSESGIKVAVGSTTFDLEIAGRNCTHVAFLIGTNDLPDGTAAATIYATINAMCTQAEGMGATCILMGLLPRATGASFTNALELRRLTLNALISARSGSIYADTDTALRGDCTATGFAPAWQSSTAYSLDNVRVNNAKAYVVTTAGTSAGSGGPTGTGTGITDGTVVWSNVPCLAALAGGATDGLHPDNTGEAIIADTVNAAVIAAGGW